MRRKSAYFYLFVFAALLSLMSFPKSVVESLQGSSVAILASLFSFSDQICTNSDAGEEVMRLKLENQLLKNEVASLKAVLNDHTKSTLDLETIPAKVIFRSPATWNSSLWINVGEADNEKFNQKIVAKNSPVLVDAAVIGVIDYVGKHQSRVRLITDSGLTPSVRAFRKEENQAWHLAKGELHGNSKPLWRTQNNMLQGIGFNYDFADKEGPARDLRSGKPLDAQSTEPAVPLIQVHDLLVTTGMDGVFPPNLPVAEVTTIKLLREGDYYYELEAKPVAGNLDELSLVFVIPPSKYDEDDQPPMAGS